MIIHPVKQGTPEWLAHRRDYRNASDAPVMMGLSKYKTREQLIHETATGVVEEVTPEMQALFNRGHQHEEWCRPHAEKSLGEDLFPITGSEGNLSASFDGLTMSWAVNWEHKMLNKDLRAAMVPGCTGADLPELYQIQMEQQHMVCTAAERTLFSASSFSPKGELIDMRECWYTPNPALAERIRRAWAQFDVDVEAYKAKLKESGGFTEVTPIVAAKKLKQLPSLVVKVEGEVSVKGNLDAYKKAAEEFLAGVKETLETDQDFVDADESAKFCADGEERLQLAKQQVIAQTGTVEEIVATIDHIHDQLRAKRLLLERLVKARKVELRSEIITKAQADMDLHWNATSERLGQSWIRRACPDFAEAMKGKRNFDSCRTAVNQVLLQAKLEMSALADRLQLNRKALVIDGKDWFHLFADFATVGTKAPEDFTAIATVRIQQHQAAEKAEQDRKDTALKERINTRMAELTQALTIYDGQPAVEIARAKFRIEANEPSADLYGDRLAEAVELRDRVLAALNTQHTAAIEAARPAAAAEQAPAPVAAAPAAPAASYRRPSASVANPTLTIGTINQRLAVVTITERGLADLNFAATVVRGAKLYFESDWPAICSAISARVAKASTVREIEAVS